MKFISLVLVSLFSLNATADLVLYTDRDPAVSTEVAARYEEATGVKVLVHFLSPGTIPARLAADEPLAGSIETADLIMTKDIALLADVASWYQPMNSALVEANVPATLRDPQGLWTAIDYRVRSLIYDTSLDQEFIDGIKTYADLAKPEYASLLCLRTSGADYTVSLTASLIATYGKEKAAEIVLGWLNNRPDTSKVYAKDDEIIVDIYNGNCRLGISNSYYLARQLNTNPSLTVGMKFLNQQEGGVHANGIALGVSRLSKQADEARKFIEFFLTDEIQTYNAEFNQYYPVTATATVPAVLASWPKPVLDKNNWSTLLPLVQESRDLLLEVNYK